MGSKKVTIGYKYNMGVHFGLTRGPVDELVAIEVGERIAATPAMTASGSLNINQPSLFGGEKKEGGIVGTFDLMMGEPTQTANAYLTEQQGPLQPGYRGLVTAVYRGQIACMNPYPKPWGFRVRRILKGWNGAVWEPTLAVISMDGGQIRAMNPAHMMYQTITDPDFGMGYPESSIDLVSLKAAAVRLFDEGFGLCLKWNKADSFENWLQLIADHVGAVICSDRATGKYRMDLIRDDYVFANLPIFGPDNILELEELEPPTLENTTNELTIGYHDPVSNRKGAITLQALASVQTQGRVVAAKRDYQGIPTGELAARVGIRDLRAASTGLKRVQLRVNRQGYTLRPGMVIRFVWPVDGMDIAMRVGEVEYGSLTKGDIKFSAVEDVFGLPANTYIEVQTPTWTPPVTTAVDMTIAKVVEASYLDTAQELNDADVAAVAVGEGHVLAYGAAPTSLSMNYGVKTRVGSAAYVEEMTGDFCPVGYTTAILLPSATTVVLENVTLEDLIQVGVLADIGGEIVQVTAYNAATNTATIVRGCGDTVPKPHPASTPMYFYGTYRGFVAKDYADGETVNVKLITRTPSDELSEVGATTRSVLMNERFDRPYPPGNLRLNNLYWPASISGASTITVSWAHRDRKSQHDQVIGFTTASVGPEPGVTYTVKVLNAVGTVVRTVTGLTGTSWGYTVAMAQQDALYDTARFQVLAVRGGLESWQVHDVDTLRDPPVVVPAPVMVTQMNSSATAGASTYNDSFGRTYTGDASVATVASGIAGFTGSCMLLSGVNTNTKFVSAVDTDDFNLLSSGDFTVEAFIQMPGLPDGSYGMGIVGSANNTSDGWQLRAVNGNLQFVFPNLAAASLPFTWVAGTTYHVQATRFGTKFFLSVNGVGSEIALANRTAEGSTQIQIGAQSYGGWGPAGNKYIAHRVSKGARYKANFTPPTSF